MPDKFTITREIGIDMAHRVTMHGSKCKNMHGHRYTIQATMQGTLVKGGEQDGMVMDFGFLKDAMMREIDAYFDHGTCLWVRDPLCRLIFDAGDHKLRENVLDYGHAWVDTNQHFGKVYVMADVPTAENLAREWFYRLDRRLSDEPRKPSDSRLSGIKVWETPNCFVEFIPF
jgi:6-pyruvoyltetrahydropterin/6-carboxytetrahydropterin synthase